MPNMPTAVKEMRGFPAHDRPNPLEPRPELAAPDEIPAHLDDAARVEWIKLIPILMDMRVMTKGDYIVLGNLCQSYSTMAKAQAILNETGMLVRSPSGYMQQSPLLGIINQCVARINLLCRELGLTPASRTKVNMIEKKAEPTNKWTALRNSNTSKLA